MTHIKTISEKDQDRMDAMIKSSANLHAALWREHESIMLALGAKKETTWA